MERTFAADIEVLHDVQDFVEEELMMHGARMREILAILVSVEELFVNIAHYAYEGRSGTARIGVSFEGDDAVITIADSGFAFDPLSVPEPDIGLDADRRTIGGLGIWMVRRSMDEFTYRRANGENVTVLKKRIRY